MAHLSRKQRLRVPPSLLTLSGLQRTEALAQRSGSFGLLTSFIAGLVPRDTRVHIGLTGELCRHVLLPFSGYNTVHHVGDNKLCLRQPAGENPVTLQLYLGGTRTSHHVHNPVLSRPPEFF